MGYRNNNAVCGNCGNAYSEHHFEKHGAMLHAFCNEITNGDVFTDEPSDSMIVDYWRKRWPETYATAVELWKADNNHK